VIQSKHICHYSVLGSLLSGWLLSDGYWAYREYENRLRCLRHLLRKARGLEESFDRQAQAFGKTLRTGIEAVMKGVYAARRRIIAGSIEAPLDRGAGLNGYGETSMKSSVVLMPMAALLAGCAATMSPQQAADYNGDGVISDAELKQFNKQASVQERNVYTESVKRRGAVNTVHDVNETIWTARSILSAIRSF